MRSFFRPLFVTFVLGLAVLRAEAATSTPSVLICGGSMMNGNHFADTTLAIMREHYAGCKKVALVLHATHPDDVEKMEARLREAFAHIGVPAAESLHHHDSAGQRALLKSADAIFIGGGETFVLLAALHRMGQLDVIRERVAAGIPYGGASAGANVAGLLIGTTNDFPVAEIPTRAALGLVPVVINPHHPLPATKPDFDARAGKIKIYLKFNPKDTVLALANTSIARLHDGRFTMEVGSGWLYTQLGVRTLEVGQTILAAAPKS